jgi:hypothetical protein|tara:strand:- start:2230 stop:2652 length:423 start_codon:yes stop_codon:yes gene_type:complete
MDYRLILIVILIVVLVSLCLNCVFKEQFQAEIERITTASILNQADNYNANNNIEKELEFSYDEVSPINTIDDIVNLYPIIDGKDTTSNISNENSEGGIIHKVTETQHTLGVTHVLQSDYAKYDPIGFDGHHNYTRALNFQ